MNVMLRDLRNGERFRGGDDFLSVFFHELPRERLDLGADRR